MMLVSSWQGKGFETTNLTSSVQRCLWLVFLVVLAPLVHTVDAASGRSTVVTLEMPRHDWLSNETVELDLRLRNAPFNTPLRAEWVLSDEQGFIDNSTVFFSATGTFTVVEIRIDRFYRGAHFHAVEVHVFDDADALLGVVDAEFIVFRQVILPNMGSLLAFGDSLSDMGNAKASILNTPDVPPYWQGRFSNGEVWLGGLYDAFGITSTIGSGAASSGSNRAFGGAQTGSGYAYLLIPNVGTQITAYLANVQASIPNNALVSLWAGGNDFLYGTANADTIATNMEAHIRQLALAGARTFVVPNLPPLEDTPEIQSRSSSQQATIRNEVIDYNNQLAAIVVGLRAELGITIYTVDAWTIFGDITANKQALGLTNVQDAACSGGSTLLPLPICNSGSAIAANVDEYVFFDKAHPTRVMHDIITRFAIEAVGEPDTDGDGVSDSVDTCVWTPASEQADSTGCGWSQRDDDADGVLNGRDLCPETSANEVADEEGCAASQRDTDNDGLSDEVDPCPASPNLIDHDGDGCADVEDNDDDNDGLLDGVDACPKGVLNPHANDLDEDGCADGEDDDIDGDGLSNADEVAAGTDQRDDDTDDDTWLDGADAFPLDSTEWKDTDRDGCGDNADRFPFDPTECTDLDEDGYGDNTDAFPLDEKEWTDIDEDGTGDNSDACLLEYGLSIVPPGCPDRDGDGYANTNDTFPNDSTEWVDTDGDGFGDNGDAFPYDENDWSDQDNDSYGDNTDAFPFDASEWNDTDGEGVGDNSDLFPLDPNEWKDTDGDGCGDNGDVFPFDPEECLDSDYDGVGDEADAFPFDATETVDTDGDGVGDVADAFPNDPGAKYDDDGDGVANARDAFPNTASFSSWWGVGAWVLGLLVLFGGAASLYNRREGRSNVPVEAIEQHHLDFQTMNYQSEPPTAAPVFVPQPAEPASPLPIVKPATLGYEPDPVKIETVALEAVEPASEPSTKDPVHALRPSDDWGELGSDWGD